MQPEQSQPSQKPAAASYEFTTMQDEIIRSLSKKMKFVGVFYIVVSVIVGLSALAFLLISPLVGFVYMILLTPELLIGIWTLNAAKSFRLVVDTKGHDIPHLINALINLRKLYTLMFWILIIGMAFMVIAVIAVIVMFSSGLIPIPTEGTMIMSML
jgi:type IV secretory pathway component VirB8